MRPELSEADRKMLWLLLNSEGRVSSSELSRQLKVSINSVREQRKRLEKTCIIKHYSLDPTKFGWRRIELLICTSAGATMRLGKTLLMCKEVRDVSRMIGEPKIDLCANVFVKDNRELLNLIEKIKTMKGVTEVVWTEVVETIGMKNPRISF
jgi:DNA-binding Lrp family transcriptional regulator